jgi:hypothetical protein
MARATGCQSEQVQISQQGDGQCIGRLRKLSQGCSGRAVCSKRRGLHREGVAGCCTRGFGQCKPHSLCLTFPYLYPPSRQSQTLQHTRCHYSSQQLGHSRSGSVTLETTHQSSQRSALLGVLHCVLRQRSWIPSQLQRARRPSVSPHV